VSGKRATGLTVEHLKVEDGDDDSGSEVITSANKRRRAEGERKGHPRVPPGFEPRLGQARSVNAKLRWLM
jgi:hypothetical protein